LGAVLAACRSGIKVSGPATSGDTINVGFIHP
jgi:hypothetical protein